jgi:phospholipase C
MSPANRTRPTLNLTFIGLLMVSISQLAIAESPDNEKENLAFTLNQLPRPDHVVIVIEENKSYKQIIGNIEAPFINHLANEGALFTNSFAVARPSQPNYLALFSGSTHGVPDNRCPISLSGDNLASQLQKKGLGFVIYSESLPSVGYDGCSSADSYYERKHNPAVNWQGKNIPPEVNMPFANFPSDYTSLPTVSMVIPNQINDMHGDQTHSDLISQGDFWLKSNLDAYVQWAKTNNSLLIVTWDEDDGDGDNHIPTIFIGPMVKPGRYITRIDHYNVLRTIIDMYGLSSIGESADAKPIAEAWKRDK